MNKENKLNLCSVSNSDSKVQVVKECKHEYECLLDTDYWSDYKCKKCGDYYMEEFD